MKLYTREQMIEAFKYGQNPKGFDWIGDMIDSLKPIELPSDEEIEKKPEEELPKKGQVCWGSNNEGEKWYIGHFVKKEFKNYILNTTVDDENTGGNFTIITTKNPYEVEEDREPEIGDICFFWNDGMKGYHCDRLLKYHIDYEYHYESNSRSTFQHCSLKNPLIK